MYKSESLKQLVPALVKAQKAMTNAVINRENPHFRSKYADLASVREAILGPLNDNGIAITQIPLVSEAGHFELVTVLLHSPSGEYIGGKFPLPTAGRPQEIGSFLTYARRYSASAMTFIASDEDDDANAADAVPVKITRQAPPKAANDNAAPEWQEPGALAFSGEGFVEWGTRFAARLKAAKTDAEITAWFNLNDDVVEAAKTKAPKVHARLVALAASELGTPKLVDQPNNKTDARETGTEKSAADDLENFRVALLTATTSGEIEKVWSSFTFKNSHFDRAVEMYEARRKQLKAAA